MVEGFLTRVSYAIIRVPRPILHYRDLSTALEKTIDRQWGTIIIRIAAAAIKILSFSVR